MSNSNAAPPPASGVDHRDLARRLLSGADAERTLQTLCRQAVVATDVAFTLTDPNLSDNPLVWVNPAFSAVTGYTLEEAVGRNCRILQGPDTDQACVAMLREAIAAQETVTVTLLNYRKDGTTFWNQLTMSPVFDTEDRLSNYVGVQTDVSGRVIAEHERERAHHAERVARHDADQANQRADLLAEINTRLAATLDVQEILERLANLVVPILADRVILELFDEYGDVERTVSHPPAGTLTPTTAPTIETTGDPGGDQRPHPLLESSEPLLLGDATNIDWTLLGGSCRLGGIIEELGASSMMYIPLVDQRRRTLASMALFRTSPAPPYTSDDLAVAWDVGRRAALTLDNARLYEHEHRVAVALQQSLLPDLPSIEDVTIAARYLPGDAHADVGGDFYEVLPLPDGSIGVAVGDVVGHDVAAAAAMGHLRGLLRACAWNSVQDGRNDPREVLERVDQLVQGLQVVPLATLFYGRLERPEGSEDCWRFTYANAGHPPPMVRHLDGTVQVLDDAPGIILGVAAKPNRQVATVDLLPGAIVVGYTDGLIERRREDLAKGLGRVSDVLRRLANGPEEVAEGLLATAGRDRDDDIAILVLQLLTRRAAGI